MDRYRQRDEVLTRMGYSSYSEYLSSPLWKRIKARIFKVCKTCPCGAEAVEIHHTTYKWRYLEGRGKIHKFLTPVCKRCHYFIEFNNGVKTCLGYANERLRQIREHAEKNGLVLPNNVKSRPRKKPKAQ